MSSPITGHAGRQRTGSKAQSGNLRDDLRDFVRNKLIEAAIGSFQELGYKETSVERIAELAGTSPPTFYRHFNSKDELLVPLQMHLSEQVQALLREMTAAEIRGPKALEGWILRYLVWWEDVRRLVKAFWDATSLDRKLERTTFLRMFDTSGTIARLRPELPENERERHELRLGMFLLMLDRLASIIALSPDEDLHRTLIAEFAEAMWTSVFASP